MEAQDRGRNTLCQCLPVFLQAAHGKQQTEQEKWQKQNWKQGTVNLRNMVQSARPCGGAGF